MPGQGLVPAENPPAEAAEPRQEEQELQEQERRRQQEARAIEEARARDEERRRRRNLTDRRKYWREKMAELEAQLARATRRGQDWLVATILEDMAVVRARAAEAG